MGLKSILVAFERYIRRILDGRALKSGEAMFFLDLHGIQFLEHLFTKIVYNEQKLALKD